MSNCERKKAARARRMLKAKSREKKPQATKTRATHQCGAKLTIRCAEWDDLPRLAAISASGHRRQSYEDLACAMDSPCLRVMVAEREGQVVGYMSLTLAGNEAKLVAGVADLVVEDTSRRRGVGRFLLDSVESHLVECFSRERPLGRIKMATAVPETWLDAQLFLKSAGFVVPVVEGKPRVGPLSPLPSEDLQNWLSDPPLGYVFQRCREWCRTDAGAVMSPGARAA